MWILKLIIWSSMKIKHIQESLKFRGLCLYIVILIDTIVLFFTILNSEINKWCDWHVLIAWVLEDLVTGYISHTQPLWDCASLLLDVQSLTVNIRWQWNILVAYMNLVIFDTSKKRNTSCFIFIIKLVNLCFLHYSTHALSHILDI